MGTPFLSLKAVLPTCFLLSPDTSLDCAGHLLCAQIIPHLAGHSGSVVGGAQKTREEKSERHRDPRLLKTLE